MFKTKVSQPVKEMIRRINEDDKVTITPPEGFGPQGFFYLEFVGANEYDLRKFPLLVDGYGASYSSIECPWMTEDEKTELFVAVKDKLSRDRSIGIKKDRADFSWWLGVAGE